ncbi:MAG: aldolase/citrate lyase family protein [Verrucomicrobiota bacterium]
MKPSPRDIRDQLNSGHPQIGVVFMYPSPGTVERIGGDWDWIWLDGQHGQLGNYDTMLAMVRACDLVGRPAMVRVPHHEFGPIGQALDMGAAGVIVPVVNTVEEAKRVVQAAKFPPLGGRSYGGRRPIDVEGRAYSDTANARTMLIVQIETPEAIENAAEIAAVDGVDALFLGPDDIMLRRGYTMTTPRSKDTLGNDMEAVANACRDAGKVSVCVGFGAEMFTLCVETGFGMIVAGGDVPFLANTSSATSAEMRGILDGRQIAPDPEIASPY